MSEQIKKWFSLNINNKKSEQSDNSCGCGSNSGGCGSKEDKSAIGLETQKDGFDQVFDVKMDRRSAFKQLTASLAVGAGAISTSCSSLAGDESKEKSQIDWEEQFKGNYKLMDR